MTEMVYDRSSPRAGPRASRTLGSAANDRRRATRPPGALRVQCRPRHALPPRMGAALPRGVAYRRGAVVGDRRLGSSARPIVVVLADLRVWWPARRSTWQGSPRARRALLRQGCGRPCMGRHAGPDSAEHDRLSAAARLGAVGPRRACIHDRAVRSGVERPDRSAARQRRCPRSQDNERHRGLCPAPRRGRGGARRAGAGDLAGLAEQHLRQLPCGAHAAARDPPLLAVRRDRADAARVAGAADRRRRAGVASRQTRG